MIWRLILEKNKIQKIYKVTLNIYIENIVKIVDIQNQYKSHWNKIYEVIQQEFFYETDILPYKFKNCKNNANLPFIIPAGVKIT